MALWNELLNARFGGHRYYGNLDKRFSIYHVTSGDNVFKGLCDLMGRGFL